MGGECLRVRRGAMGRRETKGGGRSEGGQKKLKREREKQLPLPGALPYGNHTNPVRRLSQGRSRRTCIDFLDTFTATTSPLVVPT